MSGIVQDCVDEWTALANARIHWERYWRDIAKYVLPQTEDFDMMIGTNMVNAITSVVSTPAAYAKAPDLYDMTSLWAIERLTAGLLSLKTPETEFWHGNQLDDYFGGEPTHAESVALERLRNYQFKVRSNPQSGFWAAHRSAIKSMCGFGDGWMYVEEQHGKGSRVPYRYEYRPLMELYPGMGPNGQPNRMFSVFAWSAEQIARKWFHTGNVGQKVVDMANDPKRRHETIRVMHCVKPREDGDRVGKLGVKGGAFQSHYCLPDDKVHIGEGGFYEFPFVRYAWSNTGTRPFSEGPVAYAIGELKSLQEMAKNELIATSTIMRPPTATAGRNYTKINWNPGANNPGLMSPDGKPLYSVMNTGIRPDFAQAVMEARRNSVREMLYLNLWQLIIPDTQDTATAALIKAQEKGDLFGPVGLSMNQGLSMMFDREVAILGRQRAFETGSPLEMPDSMAKKNVSPSFSSPLDRLRRMGELVGMQRLVEFALTLAGGDPNQAAKIMARFDVDEMLEQAQEILGAPIKVLVDREAAQSERDQGNQLQNALAALATLKGSGEAAKAIGEGGAAMAGGAEAVNAAPALQRMATNLPAALPMAGRAAQQAMPA